MKSSHCFTTVIVGVFICIGAVAHGQAPSGAAAFRGPRLLHTWSDAGGETHMEELRLAAKLADLPGGGISFLGRPVESGAVGTRPPASAEEKYFHNTPRRMFAMIVKGHLDLEVSDGSKDRLETGDFVFLEDVTGKGHHPGDSPHVTMTIGVPDNFDVKMWASGKK